MADIQYIKIASLGEILASIHAAAASQGKWKAQNAWNTQNTMIYQCVLLSKQTVLSNSFAWKHCCAELLWSYVSSASARRQLWASMSATVPYLSLCVLCSWTASVKQWELHLYERHDLRYWLCEIRRCHNAAWNFFSHTHSTQMKCAASLRSNSPGHVSHKTEYRTGVHVRAKDRPCNPVNTTCRSMLWQHLTSSRTKMCRLSIYKVVSTWFVVK